MDAGRELDAMVAEKVMGWHRDEATPSGLGKGPWWRDDDKGIFTTTNPDAPTSGQPGRYWSPSTDPAAAWSVVEAMREKGWTCVLCHETTNATDEKRTMVRFLHRPEGDGPNCTYAPTMPLAVSLAALAALANVPPAP